MGLLPTRKKKDEATNGNGNGNGSADVSVEEEVEKISRKEQMARGKELAVHHGAETGKDVAGWLDSRTGGTTIYTALLSRHVPKGTNWFYTLGSATMFIFMMQAITGIFLAMYYTPSATQAYASVSHMTNDVFLGEFVRGLHKWGASLMIILIFLHMARTFFFGAYKYPRELNWVIGVVLLILTMVMGLTGYLLPFDQRSFWATIVANNITASGPVVGPYLADFLRAGPDFSATTLSRFYALHMLLVPGLIGALIGAHLFLVVKLGTTAPPWVRAGRPKGAQPEVDLPAGMAIPDDEEVDFSSNGHSNGHVSTNGNAPAVETADVAAETEAPAEEAAEEAPAEVEAPVVPDEPAADTAVIEDDSETVLEADQQPAADEAAEPAAETPDSDSDAGEEGTS